MIFKTLEVRQRRTMILGRQEKSEMSRIATTTYYLERRIAEVQSASSSERWSQESGDEVMRICMAEKGTA